MKQLPPVLFGTWGGLGILPGVGGGVLIFERKGKKKTHQ